MPVSRRPARARAFKLNDKVTVTRSKENGEIVGHTKYAKGFGDERFLVISAQHGKAIETWFCAPELTLTK